MGKKPFQWGGVVLISFCHFIHDIFSSFFSPLLPLLVEKLSISLTAAGFLGTITQLPALLNPIIGRWADRGNTIRWFIVLAPTLTAIPMSLLGLAPSYGVVAILLLVKVMKPLTAILVARGFMHGSLSTFLPLFIKQETGSLWLAGAGLALYEASGVLGIFSAGPLSDRLGRRRVLGITLTLAPIFLFLFVILPGLYKVPALFCTGFTLLSTTPVMLAMIQEHARKSPSAANGFFMMASFLARSAVIVLVGYCGDLVGLKTTYYISALLGISGIPFLFMIPGTNRA